MDRNRNFTVIVLWLSYLATILYLVNAMGVLAIPIAAILMVPLIVMMNLMSGKSGKGSQDVMQDTVTSKRKRQRIDNMLRDMSDEDLYQLRQRLQDGSVDDDYLYNIVGEDGELVNR